MKLMLIIVRDVNAGCITNLFDDGKAKAVMIGIKLWCIKAIEYAIAVKRLACPWITDGAFIVREFNYKATFSQIMFYAVGQ